MSIRIGPKKKFKKKSETFSSMQEPNLFQIFISRLNKIGECPFNFETFINLQVTRHALCGFY
jgi:hypothetical protein